MRSTACKSGWHRECSTHADAGTREAPRLRDCSCQCHRKPKRRVSSHVHSWVRDAVKERDGGRCVFDDGLGRCIRRAAHVHHLRQVSLGGSDDPDNLACLCPLHHMWVHDHPAEAKRLGLLR